MAVTRGKEGVEFPISGDASPLLAEVAAAKAKIEADGGVGADSGKVAAEVTAVGTAAQGTTQALNEMGQAGDNAVGPSGPFQGGVKGLNKLLGDTVGQVQGLIGKFAIVSGVATAMYALGKAIREGVNEALKDGTDRAKEFNDELTSFTPGDRLKDYEKQIKGVEAALADALDRQEKYKQTFAGREESGEVRKLKDELRILNEQAADERKAVEAKRLTDLGIAEDKANAERLAAWEEANIQRLAAAQIAEHKRLENEAADNLKSLQDRQKAFVEDADKRIKMAEDFKDKMKKITEDMAVDQAKAASKTQEAWSAAFLSIRSQSNEVFGSNRAMGNVGVASALQSANMRAGASNSITFDGGN
jgi:hypothetical protein